MDERVRGLQRDAAGDPRREADRARGPGRRRILVDRRGGFRRRWRHHRWHRRRRPIPAATRRTHGGGGHVGAVIVDPGSPHARPRRDARDRCPPERRPRPRGPPAGPSAARRAADSPPPATLGARQRRRCGGSPVPTPVHGLVGRHRRRHRRPRGRVPVAACWAPAAARAAPRSAVPRPWPAPPAAARTIGASAARGGAATLGRPRHDRRVLARPRRRAAGPASASSARATGAGAGARSGSSRLGSCRLPAGDGQRRRRRRTEGRAAGGARRAARRCRPSTSRSGSSTTRRPGPSSSTELGARQTHQRTASTARSAGPCTPWSSARSRISSLSSRLRAASRRWRASPAGWPASRARVVRPGARARRACVVNEAAHVASPLTNHAPHDPCVQSSGAVCRAGYGGDGGVRLRVRRRR